MILVHSSEIETLKTFILKEKRLDLLGEGSYDGCIHDSNFIRMFWLGEVVCRFCDWQIKPKKIGG